MVQYQPAELDRTFGALADGKRRAILERLGSGEATISELAEPFGISLTGVKKHVGVLEEAGLVTTRRCRVATRPLDEIEGWIESYRQMLSARLDRFGELLEREKGELR
jgi:DNA-binding transcriptional ArsR family regulator